MVHANRLQKCSLCKDIRSSCYLYLILGNIFSFPIFVHVSNDYHIRCIMPFLPVSPPLPDQIN